MGSLRRQQGVVNGQFILVGGATGGTQFETGAWPDVCRLGYTIFCSYLLSWMDGYSKPTFWSPASRDGGGIEGTLMEQPKKKTKRIGGTQSRS